jgi:glutaryl-CoA dehydrogenase
MIANAHRDFNFDLGETAEAIRDTVRDFSTNEIAPRAEEIDRTNTFPRDLWPKLGALGLLGITVEEDFGGTGLGYLEHCVAMEEISRGSASVGLSYGAHSNLCVNQIRRNGNDAQKRKYLPKLISGEHVGALAMSEPGAGSDVVSMKTRADKRGDRYVLNGSKMWITNGTVADVAIVWARTDEGIAGFVVPTDTAGFSARTMSHKLSLRASITSELAFDDVRLPTDAKLPEARGLSGPLACLSEARFGIVFGAVGAARDCLEATLDYVTTREVFDKPLSAYQLTQAKLADMAVELGKAQLLAVHLGHLKDAGTIRPDQVSFGKLNNVREAIAIARQCRTLLGANGITLEYPVIRHANNLESVLTYEGTSEVHQLVIGEALTGVSAFR